MSSHNMVWLLPLYLWKFLFLVLFLYCCIIICYFFVEKCYKTFMSHLNISQNLYWIWLSWKDNICLKNLPLKWEEWFFKANYKMYNLIRIFMWPYLLYSIVKKMCCNQGLATFEFRILKIVHEYILFNL